MPVSALIRAKGAIRAPIGLICVLPTATPIPTGWAEYNRAQDYFIRGTTSDSLVNTTLAANSISLTSSTDDLHLGSLARDCEIGHTSACTTSCHTPSMNYNGSGSHGVHSLGFAFRPDGIRLKLIYANSINSFLFPGLMMFSTNNLPQHTSITYLDQAGDRLLMSHASKTEYYNGSVTPNTSTGSVNNNHIHTTAVNRQVYYLKVNEFTTVGAAGQSHTHSIPAPSTWVYKPKYVTLRSYHIADIYDPVGLIGMWSYTSDIPNGWQIVGEVNDRYIKFASTYSAGGGNDTIEIVGMTGYNAHSHPYGTSTKKSRAVSPSAHYDSVSHRHYYNHNAYPYKPATLYLKFIRYVGH